METVQYTALKYNIYKGKNHKLYVHVYNIKSSDLLESLCLQIPKRRVFYNLQKIHTETMVGIWKQFCTQINLFHFSHDLTEVLLFLYVSIKYKPILVWIFIHMYIRSLRKKTKS